MGFADFGAKMDTMNDRRPRSETTPLIRALPAALLTALVVAIAAVTVGTVVDRDRYEQAVIGLTPDSEWPFHDVNLATAASQLDDGTLVEEAQRTLGLPVDPADVTLDGQRQDDSGILRITARAPTPREAAALANAVADAIADAVPPETPVRVVDRADGRNIAASPWAVAGAGAVMGLMLGLVVWSGRLRSGDAGDAR
jgi:hypothetical protein